MLLSLTLFSSIIATKLIPAIQFSFVTMLFFTIFTKLNYTFLGFVDLVLKVFSIKINSIAI